ncbi:MAG: LON peptidase substrate-binding domain-containing protein [Anaerolineae bacterium]
MRKGIIEEELGDGSMEDELSFPEELPILPLRNTVIFPLTVLPLVVEKPRSVRLIDDTVIADRLVALVAVKDPEVQDPAPDDLCEMGTIGMIHRLARSPDDTLHVVVQGLERVELSEFTQLEPYMRANVRVAPETTETGVEVEALVRNIVDLFERLADLAGYIPEDIAGNVLDTDDPRQLAYMVATSTRMDVEVRQEILELDSVTDKLFRLFSVLTREVDVLELGKKIQSDAQSGIEEVQREYFLREQLKAIRRELGEEDGQATEIQELEEKIESVGMPKEAKMEALRELDRLAKLPPAAAEYSVIRTYLDWLTELPWQSTTEDNLDISAARSVLDEDHYDLQRVKDRIIEYLAVRKLRHERNDGESEAETDARRDRSIDHIRQEREGVILCLVGPPGVGKTSLGRSIARALGRKFIRQSLGGVHDEAEIRGHRRRAPPARRRTPRAR